MLLISFWKFFVFSNCFSLPYYANMWLSLKAQSSSLLFSIHLAFTHLFYFLISAIYRVYTYSNICHHCKNQTNLQTESFPHTFFHYSSYWYLISISTLFLILFLSSLLVYLWSSLLCLPSVSDSFYLSFHGLHHHLHHLNNFQQLTTLPAFHH